VTAGSAVRTPRQLSISHNLVHHYFRAKAELWRAAIENSLGMLSEYVRDHFLYLFSALRE